VRRRRVSTWIQQIKKVVVVVAMENEIVEHLVRWGHVLVLLLVALGLCRLFGVAGARAGAGAAARAVVVSARAAAAASTASARTVAALCTNRLSQALRAAG